MLPTQIRSPGKMPVDAEPLGGGRAQHRDRLLCGGGVEETAAGQGGAHRGGQAQAGGLDLQGVGLDGGDQRAAEDADVGYLPGALDLLHAGQAGDHARRGQRQFGDVAVEALPVLHGEQVGAELGDLGQQPGLGGGRQAQHRHDRRHPDRDPQRRQAGPQLAGAQAHAGEPAQVGGPQPGGDRGGGRGGGGHGVPPCPGPAGRARRPDRGPEPTARRRGWWCRR